MRVITIELLKNSIEKDIEQNKSLYIFHSTTFIMLGIVAMMMPMNSVKLLSMFLGLIILISGIVQIIASTELRNNKFTLISAFVSVTLGFVMILNPVAGILAFSMIVATFLMFQGIIMIAMSLEISLLKEWWVLFVAGILVVIFSVVLFSYTPYKELIYLGLMVGISMLLYGLSMLLIAIQVRPINKEEAPELIETTISSQDVGENTTLF